MATVQENEQQQKYCDIDVLYLQWGQLWGV